MPVSNNIVLAAVASLTIAVATTTEAQAGPGIHSAFVGGLVADKAADGFITNISDDGYDAPYQIGGYDAPYRRHNWHRPAPRYEYRTYRRYEPQFTYRRAKPQFSYSYGFEQGGGGYDRPRHHRWRKYGGDGGGRYENDNY